MSRQRRAVRRAVLLPNPQRSVKGTAKKDNSAASVLDAAHDVDVRGEARRIIIEPVRSRPRYTLEQLIAQSDTRKRRPREEQEWLQAPSVGREALSVWSAAGSCGASTRNAESAASPVPDFSD
jgi:hypothetical protein